MIHSFLCESDHMALVFVGSTCVICGRVLDSDPDIIGFPAFLKAGHRLAMFSDAAMHRRCLAASADGREVVEWYRRFREIWEARPTNATLEQAEAWGREAFREFDITHNSVS